MELSIYLLQTYIEIGSVFSSELPNIYYCKDISDCSNEFHESWMELVEIK